MRESLYSDGAKQGTQAPSPAPRLIPAETEHQLRTNIAIGTANGGTSIWLACMVSATGTWVVESTSFVAGRLERIQRGCVRDRL